MKWLSRSICSVVLTFAFLPAIAQPAKPAGSQNVFSGGKLLVKVAPVYPGSAQTPRVEGVVVLNVLVGTDGHVQHLNVVSGPQVLQSAAIDAVQQWVYEPFLLNGEARPVAASVSIRFTRDKPPEILPTNAPPVGQAGSAYHLPAPEPNRPRISSAVVMARLAKKVDPIYPGNLTPGNTVVLRVFISKDGRVSAVTVIAGAELLSTPAIEAVRQWEFQPYLLNGEPSEIETVMTLRPSQ